MFVIVLFGLSIGIAVFKFSDKKSNYRLVSAIILTVLIIGFGLYRFGYIGSDKLLIICIANFAVALIDNLIKKYLIK